MSASMTPRALLTTLLLIMRPAMGLATMAPMSTELRSTSGNDLVAVDDWIYCTAGSLSGHISRDSCMGHYLAMHVCEIAKSWNEWDPATPCKSWGITLAIAIHIVERLRGPTAGAERVNRRSAIDQIDVMANALNSRHLSFESIEAIPIETVHRRQVEAGQRTLLAHSLVKGIKIGHSTIDAFLADYGDGHGHVYVQPAQSGKGNLTKRDDGAGFKLTYIVENPDGTLQNDNDLGWRMAEAYGNAWADSAHAGLDQGIGYLERDGRREMTWRVIPEVRGYGLEYEDAFRC